MMEINLKDLFMEENDYIITIELNDYFSIYAEGLNAYGELITGDFNVDHIESVLLELFNENGEYIKTLESYNITLETDLTALKMLVSDDLETDYHEEIKEHLNDLSDHEIVTIWNEYQNDYSGYETIYYMEEINEILDSLTPLQVLQLGYNGNFNPNDSYFTYGVYLESHDFIEDIISYDDLTDYIIRNAEDFGDYGLADIIDKYSF